MLLLLPEGRGMSHPFDAVTMPDLTPYKSLPDPVTGKSRQWKRCTEFVKILDDEYGLQLWKQRKIVKGLAGSPDLIALAAAIDEATLNASKELNRIASASIEAAGGNVGRDLGTALHSITEHVDRGETLVVPEVWRSGVYAYVNALTQAHIDILPEYIECKVAHSTLGVAGTFDRIVRMPSGIAVIADLKSGKDLSRQEMVISMQLAMYAKAVEVYGIWDAEAQAYVPAPPDFSANTGIVMHLSVGTGECHLHEVDLIAGWENCLLAHEVRQARKGKYFTHLTTARVTL